MIRSLRFALSLALLPFVSAVAAAADTPSSAPAAREIVLVRHGNYTPDTSVDEKIGPPLSPIGVAQARLAGARLHGELSRLDGLHVSPMQRARDTAAAIGAEFPGRAFEVVDDLAECTPPTRRAEVMAKEKPEDAAACKARLDRVFATYFRPAQGATHTDLFVCHGNVIRYLVTRALGVDTAAWLEMSVGHASLTRIRVEADGRFKVIAVGDVGHIPANLRTGASGDADRSLAAPPLETAPKSGVAGA
ncbi:histidine phosphatase family protein [Dokdonella sp.]|uniref:histidine phosphatase family protein n=1 Tax=Dokdonella sp. TaxID=2291710 RepID=UPI001B0D466D|nr:histidine phosphatase family protein [Dokdonella sp.]MBO9663391.1 histidine phosphatase family protein [Dokdonella sp.]